MLKCSVALPKAGTGLVVRPAAGGGSGCSSSLQQETLIFFADEVRTLEGGSRGEPFRLGPQLALVDGAAMQPFALQGAGCAVFEPASGCVFFAAGTAVMRLSPSNQVTLAAGSKDVPGSVDGAGEAARFSAIKSLAANGRGAVYVAEPKCVRELTVTEGAEPQQQVRYAATTLVNSAPEDPDWLHLAYDRSAGMLLAATHCAVCSVPLPGGGGGSDDGASGGTGQVRLLAGRKANGGCAGDGCGSAAWFHSVRGMVSGADLSLHVMDNTDLRRVDGHTTVSTVSAACFAKASGGPAHLAILPSGHFAAVATGSASLEVIGGGFAASTQPTGDLVKHLGAAAGCSGAGASGAADSRGGAVGSGGPGGRIVTIRVADQVFDAHRSLLACQSAYFKQLFEGGFADSAAMGVLLEDANPEAFGWLLAYMYRGVLEVPYSLLRPAAELAGRLVMPAVCHELSERLMTTCTPESVVSNLLWAEKHSMEELVAQLKAYFVRYVREVTVVTPRSAMEELAATCPRISADLMYLVAAVLREI